jgi:hypothetical protein
MPSGQVFDAVYLLGFIVLVAASLLSRRLPVGQMARYGLIWAAIVAAILLALHFLAAIPAAR